MNTLTPQEEEQLATYLEEALNDHDAHTLYLTFVRKFPKSLLLETLEKVLAVPKEKIRKTRGAYYNYLMSVHERSGKYNSRP